jgi:hypothetical protein
MGTYFYFSKEEEIFNNLKQTYPDTSPQILELFGTE